MKKVIITIGREYGSGGRIIGRKLAEELGFKFYDKELLEEVARKSQLAPELISRHDEKPNGMMNSLFASTSSYSLPLNQKVFLAQFETIREIAEKDESCVIVGRCADYILEDRKDVVNVFIHAPLDQRIKRIVELYNADEKKALETIKKIDKKRASYYNFFTNKKWGRSLGYHLSIDSSLGLDQTVQVIKQYVLLKGE